MPDLMEVDSDSLEEDRSLNDQTLESGMIMYHDLGIGDVISPEEYLWRIRRSQICISNGERKDDLETSNQEMQILNNDFKIQGYLYYDHVKTDGNFNELYKQKQEFEGYLNQWMGDRNQMDDILLIGFEYLASK